MVCYKCIMSEWRENGPHEPTLLASTIGCCRICGTLSNSQHTSVNLSKLPSVAEIPANRSQLSHVVRPNVNAAGHSQLVAAAATAGTISSPRAPGVTSALGRVEITRYGSTHQPQRASNSTETGRTTLARDIEQGQGDSHYHRRSGSWHNDLGCLYLMMVSACVMVGFAFVIWMILWPSIDPQGFGLFVQGVWGFVKKLLACVLFVLLMILIAVIR
ncbi:hypothetical protein BKA62DRAFT_259039 [Auriculariales sp. MPI-PUGE-AT-0066]|nr:hypothetical protein BKA62DRAFT_259039 [Auriculariales sp. MPI-PUGE-AT-0066]